MTDFDFERDIGVQFLLDANAINSRQKDPDVNRLERWDRDGVITLVMSERSQDEATAGGDPRRTRKALGHMATITQGQTNDETKLKRQIEAILFPNGGATNQNERNDVDIVFDAEKYGALVTNDGGSRRQPGGILGNADALLRIGIRVMRPSEAVRNVAEWILVRDRNARQHSEQDRTPLPDWVGKD